MTKFRCDICNEWIDFQNCYMEIGMMQTKFTCEKCIKQRESD